MENPFQKKESELDESITTAIAWLRGYDEDSKEYKESLASVERLMKLRREERGDRVSMDTVVNVAGTLLGILVIVAYEQKHVMVSKALGFVQRNKSTGM